MDNDQNSIELRQKLDVAEEEIARLRIETTKGSDGTAFRCPR